MKTKTYIITLLLAIAAASACTREKLDPASEASSVVAETHDRVIVPFTVEAGEPQTRVAMDGSTTDIVFSEGDQLLVYCWKIVEPSILTLKSGAGERSATFTGNLALAAGKTEADLAGKTLIASLIPQEGVSQGIFNYNPNEKRLTVDYSTKSIDSDLEALFSRTAIYQGSTKYEDRRFEFRLLTGYLKMDVTVPSEESSLARDYTVQVTADYHIPTKATNSGLGWGGSGEYAAVSGTLRASSATRGTAYMAILADSSMRVEDDGVMYDEVKFQVTMDNDYKEYGLVGGVIDHQVIEPGKGYTRTVTLEDPANEDVLLGQPASVRTRIMSTYSGDKNSNGYLSKYEAAQMTAFKLNNNTALTDASFLKYFTGMTTLTMNAFDFCKNLKKVLLPKNLSIIGPGAISDCDNLTSVIIPSGITEIGNGAFSGSGLTRITVPVGATLGESVFAGCEYLTGIDLPNGLTEIPFATFLGCSSLESITIPATVKSIGKQAFGWCISLETITIPSSVEKMGYHVFEKCKYLTKVYCYPATPPQAIISNQDEFFYECGLMNILVPSGSVSAYRNHPNWSLYRGWIYSME